MILQELQRLYHHLMEDEEKVQKKFVYPPGFSNEGIGFRIIINESGEFVSLEDLREGEGKNVYPSRFVVPKWDGKRTSGIRPYFLWDNSKYVLGIEKKGETPEAKDAFIKYLNEICSVVQRKPLVVEVIEKFLNSDEEIEKVKNHKNYNELLDSQSFIGFSLHGADDFLVTDDEDIRQLWFSFLNKTDAESELVEKTLFEGKEKDEKEDIQKRHSFPTFDIDLVTGREGPIHKLQPTIKRAIGQSGKNDIPLISFNSSSFLSYGFSPHMNAPISRETTFAFTTALNYLINDFHHNIFVGDTRTLFWAEKNLKMESLFGLVLSNAKKVETEDKDLEIFIQSLRKGVTPPELRDDESRFFILGLAPNAARVSVKYWYTSSVSEIIQHLSRHIKDSSIVGPESIRFPTIKNLLRQTAVAGKDENIPSPQISALYRSVIEGYPYPAGVLALLLNRMRHDQDNHKKQVFKIGYYRAAFIKAILNRNYKKEITMSLDKNRESTAYLCGRLFAVLEKIQKDALGDKINATIKDRYFSTASTNPRVVFPQIIRLSQNHQKKIRSEHPDWAVHSEKILQNIIKGIDTFPAFFNIADQGEFAIGYYHQTQDFYTKKNSE